jgi:hypothetical protein
LCRCGPVRGPAASQVSTLAFIAHDVVYSFCCRLSCASSCVWLSSYSSLRGMASLVSDATPRPQRRRSEVPRCRCSSASLLQSSQPEPFCPLLPACQCFLGMAPLSTFAAIENRLTLCRVDPRKVLFAHPQLAPAIVRALGIPTLKDVVKEVLDGTHPPQPVDQIQVGTFDNASLVVHTTLYN